MLMCQHWREALQSLFAELALVSAAVILTRVAD